MTIPQCDYERIVRECFGGPAVNATAVPTAAPSPALAASPSEKGMAITGLLLGAIPVILSLATLWKTNSSRLREVVEKNDKLHQEFVMACGLGEIPADILAKLTAEMDRQASRISDFNIDFMGQSWWDKLACYGVVTNRIKELEMHQESLDNNVKRSTRNLTGLLLSSATSTPPTIPTPSEQNPPGQGQNLAQEVLEAFDFALSFSEEGIDELAKLSPKDAQVLRSLRDLVALQHAQSNRSTYPPHAPLDGVQT